MRLLTYTNFAALSLGMVLCLTGCEAAKNEAVTPVAANGQTTKDRVTTGPPVRKAMRLFTEQPGKVLAFEETPIVSKIQGYVDTVNFDIGDKVTKGQTLLAIHAPEYEDQLEQKRGLLGQAEAQVKQAEASLVASQASANSAKALVSQAEAGIGRTEAEFARWESEYNRIKELASSGAVTTKLADEVSSQFQAAQSAKQEAIASIDSAKARQQEAEANVLTAQADVDAAKSKLRVAQADIQLAETMLKYRELVSPFDGFVTSRGVDAGHYVQPAGASNAMPLMTIANVSRVRVFINVPESESIWVDAGFGDPMKGDKATISVGSNFDKAIEARVTRTRLELDPQSRSLATEIDLENADLKLLPGAFVTVKILLEERADVLTLPIAAIVKTPSETVCCVVRDGKIEQRPIQLGLRVGDEVEVRSGLNGDENIVLARASSLKVGQEVDIIQKK